MSITIHDYVTVHDLHNNTIIPAYLFQTWVTIHSAANIRAVSYTHLLKSLILFGIRGMAAYAYHAMTLGYTDTEVNEFFAKALFALGEDWDMDLLLPIVMETGKYNLSCMELLDRANTATYGTPAPVTVRCV